MKAERQLMKVVVTKDGPYLVSDDVPLFKQVIGANEAGESMAWRKGDRYPASGTYALCRCGASKSKPFCDGAHSKIGFNGTEIADRHPYLEQAETFEGPDMVLTDVTSLCAYARFCDRNGSVWRLIEQSDDPQVRRMLIEQTEQCPSGRLIAWKQVAGAPAPLEPKLEPSIGLVEDPGQNVSGPLWLRGGISLVAADGTQYEIRNRVTLCRCGASKNKPFCDGSHASVGFRAELSKEQ